MQCAMEAFNAGEPGAGQCPTFFFGIGINTRPA
jgi:hypothetical protein